MPGGRGGRRILIEPRRKGGRGGRDDLLSVQPSSEEWGERRIELNGL